ncbi:hypothetical protein MKW35_17610, partial [Aestuariibaculum sp. L182]|nr:hypothetical protein [Aestuariibaculum lutulentum]
AVPRQAHACRSLNIGKAPTLTIVPECRRGGMESLTDRDPQPAPRVHDAIAGFVQADRSIKDRQRCFSCQANGDDAPAP